jgi:hypothetical protein
MAALNEGRRVVLHLGSGHAMPGKLHPIFDKGWREVRVDIDPAVKPDIRASLVDLRDSIGTASVQAVWSSHSVEHLRRHEVPLAFAEMTRVLSDDGFCLIRCPNLEEVCLAVINGDADAVAYTSPAGPITPLEMMFGHGASIERGNRFMEHHTGFTASRIARLLLEAGFGEVRVNTSQRFELWTIAFMPRADVTGVVRTLAARNLSFDDEA